MGYVPTELLAIKNTVTPRKIIGLHHTITSATDYKASRIDSQFLISVGLIKLQKTISMNQRNLLHPANNSTALLYTHPGLSGPIFKKPMFFRLFLQKPKILKIYKFLG